MTIDHLVTNALAPWRGYESSRAELDEYFSHLNDVDHNVFIYDIFNGHAELVEKSMYHPIYSEHSNFRARLYLDFLRRSLDGVTDLTIRIALFVGDSALPSPKAPVFSFQKEAGNKCILLPDVGLINPSFFNSPDHEDKLGYDDKRIHAVFAGTTTGGGLSVDAIKRGTHSRVRAAMYFRDNPDVDFLLPFIRNCDSDEAMQILKDAGFGDQKIVSWASQLKSLFILGMDGNGPSPGRIMIALKSNSVLAQYASPHELYYFPALVPAIHYLRVDNDRQMLHFIDAEKAKPGFFRNIAEAGISFAYDYLAPERVAEYTRMLLMDYEKCMKFTS